MEGALGGHSGTQAPLLSPSELCFTASYCDATGSQNCRGPWTGILETVSQNNPFLFLS